MSASLKEGPGLFRWLRSVFWAVAFSVAVFLVLPLLQVIGGGGGKDDLLRLVDVAQLPPPVAPQEPPPEQKQEEPEPEPDQAPPAPLDLSQLELALNPGAVGGDGAGMIADLTRAAFSRAAEGVDVEEVFSASDLDQPPKVVNQVKPNYPPELRKQEITGRVLVAFTVLADGRVTNVRVDQSTNPAFDQAALAAVRQWRFEPGQKGGKSVSFRMRIPISFKP
ncbi:MAG: energy transducer TonB [Verrucomicrobiae bacterium]|nr:energy transducer TonB [Verrucomicrobiae bacterium]